VATLTLSLLMSWHHSPYSLAETSESQLARAESTIFVFDQTVTAIEEAWGIIEGFECPEDFTG
jgi:hypothetical protein